MRHADTEVFTDRPVFETSVAYDGDEGTEDIGAVVAAIDRATERYQDNELWRSGGRRAVRSGHGEAEFDEEMDRARPDVHPSPEGGVRAPPAPAGARGDADQSGGDPSAAPTFKCPITHEILRDPVMPWRLMAAGGHSYERRAIQHWLTESRVAEAP